MINLTYYRRTQLLGPKVSHLFTKKLEQTHSFSLQILAIFDAVALLLLFFFCCIVITSKYSTVFFGIF